MDNKKIITKYLNDLIQMVNSDDFRVYTAVNGKCEPVFGVVDKTKFPEECTVHIVSLRDLNDIYKPADIEGCKNRCAELDNYFNKTN